MKNGLTEIEVFLVKMGFAAVHFIYFYSGGSLPFSLFLLQQKFYLL